MKFTLICEYSDTEKITHEFEMLQLEDVLFRMQDFLKGCGYVFDGTLCISEEDTPDPYAPDVGEKPRQEELDLDGRC